MVRTQFIDKGSDSARAWQLLGNDPQAQNYFNYIRGVGGIDKHSFRDFFTSYLQNVPASYSAYMDFFHKKWGIDKAFQERFPNAILPEHLKIKITPPTQNTGRVNPRSPVTNNPQVSVAENEQPPTTIITPPPLSPVIKIPTTRYPDNPRAINPSVQQNISGNASYFTGYTDTTLKPETKTSFVTTPQQLQVLQAMEEQKIREKTLTTEQQNQHYLDQKPNNMTMTFNGQDVTEKSLATIVQQKKTAQEQKQIQQDFQNRTNEDRLNNAIQKLLDSEKYDPQACSDCNLTAYLAQRGFDVNKPETIPSDAITVSHGKLDTAQQMKRAGISENIIQVRLQNKTQTVDNPNNTTTNIMTNTQIPDSSNVNWTTYDPILIDPSRLHKINNTIFYTPPEQEMVNTSDVSHRPITWTSAETRQPTLIQEALSIPTTIVDPIPTSNLSGLALLATAFLIM